MDGSVSSEVGRSHDIYDLDGKNVALIYLMKPHEETSAVDIENDIGELTSELKKRGFEVKRKDYLDVSDLKEHLKHVATEVGNLTCLWVFVFTTRDIDNECIQCLSGVIELKQLWHPFTAENCTRLFGAPKLFFVETITEEEDTEISLMNKLSGELKKDIVVKTLPASVDIMLALFKRHGKDLNKSMAYLIAKELESKPGPQNIFSIMSSLCGRRVTYAPRFTTTICKQLYLPKQMVSSDPAMTVAVETSLEQYAMSGKRVAYSFIFRDFLHDFKDDPLRGSYKDKITIEKAMKSMNFEYEDCNKNWKLTADEMKAKLKEIAENKENADCVMIFVSTHGSTRNGIEIYYAYEGCLPLSEIVRPFKESKGFRGKPKIFIVDACRGSCKEKVAKKAVLHCKANCFGTMNSEKREPEKSDIKSKNAVSCMQYNMEVLEEIPNGSDILIGQATLRMKLHLQQKKWNVNDGYEPSWTFTSGKGFFNGVHALTSLF
ncbi:uncharacterized protein LOC124169480 isoform X2 [Ischnura elegans]|uniref:uncharacterized protein LOC124169480 isoform X2 n=1 Tax=Ischnura elegans TaxID=197161 RepID=UPI001ED89754|nr:uncharacterized protein LOC124169480 isoform X2 [Ischnura elegans]